MAVSPGGSLLASGDDDNSWTNNAGDGTVKIWDSTTGKERFVLKGHSGHIECLAFSLDGKRLASGSRDTTVIIWDTATGEQLHSLAEHDNRVVSVAFSPGGRWLASGSWDNTVKIWDTANGNKILDIKKAGYVDVSFGPEDKMLASFASDAANDYAVTIWDVPTARELFTLKGHASGVTSVAFSPDGQRLASGSFDDTVRIWDLATGKELFNSRATTVPFGAWLSVRTGTPASADVAVGSTCGRQQKFPRKSGSAEQLRSSLPNSLGGSISGRTPKECQRVPDTSPTRKEAISVAQTYAEDPNALNNLAWSLVKPPEGEMSGYRKALPTARKPARLNPRTASC